MISQSRCLAPSHRLPQIIRTAQPQCPARTSGQVREALCQIASTLGVCTVQIEADGGGRVLPHLEHVSRHSGRRPGGNPERVTCARLPRDSDRRHQALIGRGMESTQARSLVQAPRTQPHGSAFTTLMEYPKDSRAKELTPPAILHESLAFLTDSRTTASVCTDPAGRINFRSRLEVARQRGDDERALRELSQKLLIQQRAAGMHR